MSETGIDPEMIVTWAVVCKVKYGHTKGLKEMVETYPGTKIVYGPKFSSGHLLIVPKKPEPIMELDET